MTSYNTEDRRVWLAKLTETLKDTIIHFSGAANSRKDKRTIATCYVVFVLRDDEE